MFPLLRGREWGVFWKWGSINQVVSFCWPFLIPGLGSNQVNIVPLCYMIQGKYEQQYEQSEEFQQELKMKVREILTEQEWRRRKMQMRVC